MANTDSADQEPVKKQVATHEYTGGAAADVVETEEEARGIKYTLLGVDKPFYWSWDQASEAERIMLAVFGAKTLATNESSQIRNNPKIKGTDAAGPDVQMQAVIDRFGFIRAGNWFDPDRTREAGVPRIDKDALAEAICQVLVKSGKKTQAEVDNGHKAAVRQRLDDVPQYVKDTRQVPEVAAAYSAIVGRPQATVDQLDF